MIATTQQLTKQNARNQRSTKVQGGGAGSRGPTNRIGNEDFGDEWLSGVIAALMSVNRAAKRTDRRRSASLLYSLKAAMLNQLIVGVEERTIVNFAYQDSDRECYLLVTLASETERRTFHLPLRKLSAASWAVVRQELGAPPS